MYAKHSNPSSLAPHMNQPINRKRDEKMFNEHKVCLVFCLQFLFETFLAPVTNKPITRLSVFISTQKGWVGNGFLTQPWQRLVTTWVYKAEAANTV